MLKNKKTAIGIAILLLLALAMAKGYSLTIEDFFSFFARFLFGLFISYQIVAYIFGWIMPMLTFSGGLNKGENNILRLIMFLVFICFWLWMFLTG